MLKCSSRILSHQLQVSEKLEHYIARMVQSFGHDPSQRTLRGLTQLHQQLIDSFIQQDGWEKIVKTLTQIINHLTPNGQFSGRTAQLTYRCCILYIYSTNIRIEYFKHAAHSPFFSSSKCRLFHNATFSGSCIIHILYTGCAKI